MFLFGFNFKIRAFFRCLVARTNRYLKLILNLTNVFQAYTDPDQIDLYPAGLSETPLPGGILGPTFSQMVGEQFRALKDGDRFFFTHNYQSGGGVGYPTNIQVIFQCSGSLDNGHICHANQLINPNPIKKPVLQCMTVNMGPITPKARQVDPRAWVTSITTLTDILLHWLIPEYVDEDEIQ